ncbi:MAG: DUF3365 domain-containing protein [Candidatus Brocadiales bacterium]
MDTANGGLHVENLPAYSKTTPLQHTPFSTHLKKYARQLACLLVFIFVVGTAPVTFSSEEIKSSESGIIASDPILMEEALYNLADKLTEMLLSMRNVIALNQDMINTCPKGGNYVFKGFVPAAVGTQVGQDFYLKTGIKIKQTSLRLRNSANAPNEWERNALEMFEAPSYPKGIPHAEIVKKDGEEAYCYIKPIYISKACLPCHGKKEKIDKDILKYIEDRYPDDSAFCYKEGELRGGLSITISITEQTLADSNDFRRATPTEFETSN